MLRSFRFVAVHRDAQRASVEVLGSPNPMCYEVTGGRYVHHALLMDWQPYGPRQSVPLRANFGHLLLDAAVRHLVFSRVQAPSQRDSVTDLSVVWAEFERACRPSVPT